MAKHHVSLAYMLDTDTIAHKCDDCEWLIEYSRTDCETNPGQAIRALTSARKHTLENADG